MGTGCDVIKQCGGDVEVHVQAWSEDTLPPANIDTGWIPLTCRMGTLKFGSLP